MTPKRSKTRRTCRRSTGPGGRLARAKATSSISRGLLGRFAARLQMICATGEEARRGRCRSRMKVKELGHVVLFVEDLERSRRFYRDLLGFSEIPGEPAGFAAFSSGRK